VLERRDDEEPAAYQARRVRERVLIIIPTTMTQRGRRLISEDAFWGVGCSSAAEGAY
jgi:hypothetical protein